MRFAVKLRDLVRKNFLKRALAALAIAGGAGALLWWAVPWLWPLPEGLDSYSPPGAVILDRTGEAIAHLPGRDYYRGGRVEWEDIPQDFICATLAAEDKRFFSHGGLDLLALGRALHSNFHAGRVVSGASTISQQLVKVSSFRGKRDVWVKFREFFQARHLEMTHSKKEILNAYLERIDYGNLREGAVSAARFYFGKRLKDLSLAESALLVSLPQSPTRMNPLRHPDRALKRRNWVLERMESEFDYSHERIERAKAEPMVFSPENTSSVVAPHLMSRLIQRGASGEVKTTLDGKLQAEVQRIVLKELDELKDKDVGQAAVLVLDNATGEALAWVGSANRSDPSGGLLDGVLVPRSAGSTLKPFVYALAFRHGAWAGQVLPDVPTIYRSVNGGDAPRNYNNRYRGPLTIREALACSQNIPAMRALQFAGGAEAFVPYLHRLGFETVVQSPGDYGLGLAIGNAEVRLLDLTRSYALLARGGKSLSVHLSPESEDILDEGAEAQLVPPAVCFVLADILSDKMARVDAFGLQPALDLPFSCAVKTGTSSDFRDNWCVGFTKEYTVGVWAGNFDFRRMKNIGGVSGAGPIFSAVMSELYKGRQAGWFTPPEGVERVEIDCRNGLACAGMDIPAEFRRKEWAFSGNLPKKASADQYDGQGRFILSSLYSEWYDSVHNSRRDAYALSRTQWNYEEEPRIVSPVPKSQLVLDPELREKGRFVHLKSNLPEGARWSSPTLRIFRENGCDMAELVPGRHEIKVVYPELGLECETFISVKSI